MFDRSPEGGVTMDSESFKGFLTQGLYLPQFSKTTVVEVEDIVYEREIPILNSEEDLEKLKDGKIDELETKTKITTVKGYSSQREVYKSWEDDDQITVYSNFPRKDTTTFMPDIHEPDEEFLDFHESRAKPEEEVFEDAVGTTTE